MKELKPCPFCGGEAELLCAPPASGLKSKWLVICKNHCANQYPHESAEKAIEAWNRRAEKQEDKNGR